MKQLALLLLMLCAHFSVSAEDGTAAGALTLRQAVAKVLAQHPQFEASRLDREAADARVASARVTPPSSLTLEVENAAGTGDYQAVDRAEVTLSLVKVLELGGKVSAREHVALTSKDLLRSQQDSQRLDLLAATAQHFVHVLVDQHRLSIARQNRDLADRTAQTVARRVEAGKTNVVEQRQARIRQARADIDLEHAEHELLVSRLRLASRWASTSARFAQAQGDLFGLPPVAPFDELAARLDSNPELVRLATQQRLADARLQWARSRRTPDLELSGGIRYFNQRQDGAFALSATIPWGTAARAKPSITEQRLLAERAPFDYDARRLDLYTELYEIYQEMLHARTAVEVLDQRVLPEAERAARDYQAGYESGRFSLPELLRMQQILLEARLEKVIAAGNFHRLRIEIERLTGQSLDVGAAQ